MWQLQFCVLNFLQKLPMLLSSTLIARSEQSLPTARFIALAATLTAVACALVIVPITAFGDDATTPEVSERLQHALDVRQQVNELNETAIAEAPKAVGATCGRTLAVEGIGDACVTPDGMLRVEQADGRSHTIHGADAPPVGTAAFAAPSQAAVTGADVSDVQCVGADQAHYVLVYARPANVTSRFATIAPKLRSEIYKVSAFIDSESRAITPTAGRRIPLRCDAGEPTVLQATLDTLSSGTASFGNIVDALRGQGYEYNGGGSGTERYIVYYDSPSPSGAAGTGHVFTSDSSAGAGNQNNKGGLFAIEYRFDQGGGVPHWEVLIHEVIHTMGGVVNNASNASGLGHCTDGQDIMCYQDAPSTSYNPSVCATKVLDCNRNDYFNPAPAPGSFLATNWNIAAGYNRWLLAAAGGDASPPTSVTGLAQTGASNAAVGVSWTVASDDRAVSYLVSIREPGGGWREVLTTTRMRATVAGLAPMTAYEVGVTPRDTAGNLGAMTIAAASTNDQPDLTAPANPAAATARITGKTIMFSWNDSGDDVGVAEFEVRHLTSLANPARRETRSAGRTPDTTMAISTTGMRPGTRYEFEILAHDAAANTSVGTSVSVVIPRDRVRPTKPKLRVGARTRTSLTLAWSASRDNVALRGYAVYQQVGTRWKLLRAVPDRVRGMKITGLRSASTYAFRVEAIDTSANRSARMRAVAARTL